MAPIIGTILVVASGSERHHLFYLLFLPTIWVSINYGYNAAALLILAIQVCLFAALTCFHVDDGQFIVFQTLMFILAATGLLLGAVITERGETTRLLRHQQAQLARVSAQALAGAMALSVAHEISQPLASLSTYVHIARRLIAAGRYEPQVLNALNQAEAQATRTRAMIERIRDFVSSGRLELRDVDVAEIARKIVALNVEEAAAESVTLSAEGADQALIVRADPTAIEQALNNLVSNAIDSASTSDKRGGHVLVRLERKRDHVVLNVEDDGAGVAPDIADKLFEVFETTKSKGMGLGLPLTRQIVERHSGRLDWSPREPRGARFFIELPIHGPEARAA
jgi:C4-dicarboxylate-specific signal transduction histidine kinase